MLYDRHVHQSSSHLYPPHQSHKKAGTMWREAGLGWKDFLPEDVDVNKFVTEKVSAGNAVWNHR